MAGLGRGTVSCRTRACMGTRAHIHTPFHITLSVVGPGSSKAGLGYAFGIGCRGCKFLPSLLFHQTDSALGLESRQAPWRGWHNGKCAYQV